MCGFLENSWTTVESLGITNLKKKIHILWHCYFEAGNLPQLPILRRVHKNDLIFLSLGSHIYIVFLSCTRVQPINNAVTVSGAQRRDSAIHTHVSTLPRLASQPAATEQ